MARRTPVRAYIGSAEILGTLICDEPFDTEREVHAQLHLREPVVAFPGVRFVLRRPSPMMLLGGGRIQGGQASIPTDDETTEELAVRSVLRERGLEAVEIHKLAAAANLRRRSSSPRSLFSWSAATSFASAARARTSTAQRRERCWRRYLPTWRGPASRTLGDGRHVHRARACA